MKVTLSSWLLLSDIYIVLRNSEYGS